MADDWVEFQKQLASLTEKEWESLFSLLPEINITDSFGKIKGEVKLEDGSFSFPYWEPAEVVDKTITAINKLRITPVFDWKNWTYGKEILNNKELDYKTLDMLTLCKLLTLIIRADRFSEGYLIACFQNGLMTKIIKAMETTLK